MRGVWAYTCFMLHMQPARKATQGLKELFINPPSHCLACSELFEEEHDHEANVYHGDPFALCSTAMAVCTAKYIYTLPPPLMIASATLLLAVLFLISTHPVVKMT